MPNPDATPQPFPDWISDLASVLFILVVLAMPLCWRFGSWVERACAVGLFVRLGFVVVVMAIFGADHPAYPSRVLLAGLDLLMFSYFMGLVFAADRRFTLVLAAAALIGAVAQVFALFGFAPAALELLTASRAGGVVMVLALLAGTGAHTIRRRQTASKPQTASKRLHDRTGSISLL